mgnify:CR=1 FL=1
MHMDHETNAKNDKISLRRLISNVAYIMKFAVEIDRRAVITVFIAFFVCSVTYAVYSTLFLKYFIQIMQRQDVDLVCSILFVLCGVAILFISAAVGKIYQICGYPHKGIKHRPDNGEKPCGRHKERRSISVKKTGEVPCYQC